MEQTLEEALTDTGIGMDKISLFFFHQANLRILRKVARDLSIPPDKVPLTIERYGNTSSASLPITLDEAVRAGRVRHGDLLYLGTFGGGLTWGGMLIRW
jgi:3-oxoacyl-[acyl-carrier-protein] synthase-3